MPKISIIIPTYNRVNQLKQSIKSIQGQSYSDWNIIVVDDCSDDSTINYINNLGDQRISVYRNQRNSGPGFSRKFGYQHAHGEFIIFCDDDDYYTDMDFFKNAIKRLEQDKDLALICANSDIYYEAEDKTVSTPLNFEDGISTREYLENFQVGLMKPHSTFETIFRKTTLETGKLTDMEMVNDSSIYLRALLAPGKVGKYDGVCGIYRVHSQNISANIQPNFICQNLDEKYKVYEIIKQRKLFKHPDDWLNKQIELTAVYFMDGAAANDKKNRQIVYDWIRKYAPGSNAILHQLHNLAAKKNLASIKRRVFSYHNKR